MNYESFSSCDYDLYQDCLPWIYRYNLDDSCIDRKGSFFNVIDLLFSRLNCYSLKVNNIRIFQAFSARLIS